MRLTTLKCGLVTSLAFVTVSAVAVPVTITFDDIDASQADVPIVGLYQGLTWENVIAYSAVPGFDGFNNGIASTPTAAYSGGETDFGVIAPVVGALVSAGRFDFVSADFGAAYYGGLVLTAQGLRAGSTIYTQVLTLGTGGAQTFSFNFANIDRLLLSSARTINSTDPYACGTFNCTQFTMDNVTVTPLAIVTEAPEPNISALMLLGLGAIAGARQLRRRRSDGA